MPALYNIAPSTGLLSVVAVNVFLMPICAPVDPDAATKVRSGSGPVTLAGPSPSQHKSRATKPFVSVALVARVGASGHYTITTLPF